MRTQIFEAIRAARTDKTFDMDEVAAIDAMLDKLGVPRVEGGNDWLPFALSLIKQFEGCKLTAYPDPGTGGKPFTIGWGSTTDGQGAAIAPGTKWTQPQADQRLASHVAEFARGVDKLLGGAATTAAQKGALVSLAYNIGLGNLGSSTLLRKHNAADYDGAAAQFAVWNKAAGKVMQGLVNRRTAEARVYKGLPA